MNIKSFVMVNNYIIFYFFLNEEVITYRQVGGELGGYIGKLALSLQTKLYKIKNNFY